MKTVARRCLALVGVGALAVGAVAFEAVADHVSPIDPNDTRGPLDVRSVEMDGTDFPRWRVVTFGGWSAAELFDLGYVTVVLDTFGSTRADYFVLVGSNGTKLYAHLWRDRASKPDFKEGRLDVSRMDRRNVSVRLPLDHMKIGERRTFYGWRVETLFTGEGCRRVCFDFVPDEGRIIEPLPVVPSPTLTPTPSP